MPSRSIRSLPPFSLALVAALALPGAALALDAEPGEVVVKFEPGSTAHTAQAARRRAEGAEGRERARRAARAALALRRRLRRAERAARTPRRPARLHPERPGPREQPRGVAGRAVELRRPGRRERPAGLGEPDRRRAPRRPRRHRRGARHRRRLRQPPPVRDLTGLQRARSSCAASTSSTATPTRSTATGTARTSRARSPRRPTTASASPGWRTACELLPVRVLDAAGEGNASDIAAGIRYATRRGAKIINLSLEFDTDVTAGDIPQILEAVAYARARGSLVVAASGNEGRARVAYPARANGVLSVGATTEHACLSEFSNGGSGLDIVAPGGGADATLTGDANCRPGRRPRAQHLPGHAARPRGRQLRHPEQLRGHVDGGAACRRHRGARSSRAACSGPARHRRGSSTGSRRRPVTWAPRATTRSTAGVSWTRRAATAPDQHGHGRRRRDAGHAGEAASSSG